MGEYLLLSCRPWQKDMAANLHSATGETFHQVTSPGELENFALSDIKPDLIFVPHWSWLIPKKVWRNYETIIFHMTDLPFGRGGSPLQNLIARGYEDTMISALRCTEQVDAGPIYMKQPLSLHGRAEEIYMRASDKMIEMIKYIIKNRPVPIPQVGDPVVFKRRQPEESNISQLKTLQQVFDYIRMLDATGYPHAFLESGSFRFEFDRAALKKDKIEANVSISLK